MGENFSTGGQSWHARAPLATFPLPSRWKSATPRTSAHTSDVTGIAISFLLTPRKKGRVMKASGLGPNGATSSPRRTTTCGEVRVRPCARARSADCSRHSYHVDVDALRPAASSSATASESLRMKYNTAAMKVNPCAQTPRSGSGSFCSQGRSINISQSSDRGVQKAPDARLSMHPASCDSRADHDLAATSSSRPHPSPAVLFNVPIQEDSKATSLLGTCRHDASTGSDLAREIGEKAIAETSVFSSSSFSSHDSIAKGRTTPQNARVPPPPPLEDRPWLTLPFPQSILKRKRCKMNTSTASNESLSASVAVTAVEKKSVKTVTGPSQCVPAAVTTPELLLESAAAAGGSLLTSLNMTHHVKFNETAVECADAEASCISHEDTLEEYHMMSTVNDFAALSSLVERGASPRRPHRGTATSLARLKPESWGADSEWFNAEFGSLLIPRSPSLATAAAGTSPFPTNPQLSLSFSIENDSPPPSLASLVMTRGENSSPSLVPSGRFPGSPTWSRKQFEYSNSSYDILGVPVALARSRSRKKGDAAEDTHLLGALQSTSSLKKRATDGSGRSSPLIADHAEPSYREHIRFGGDIATSSSGTPRGFTSPRPLSFTNLRLRATVPTISKSKGYIENDNSPFLSFSPRFSPLEKKSTRSGGRETSGEDRHRRAATTPCGIEGTSMKKYAGESPSVATPEFHTPKIHELPDKGKRTSWTRPVDTVATASVASVPHAVANSAPASSQQNQNVAPGSDESFTDSREETCGAPSSSMPESVRLWSSPVHSLGDPSALVLSAEIRSFLSGGA